MQRRIATHAGQEQRRESHFCLTDMTSLRTDFCALLEIPPAFLCNAVASIAFLSLYSISAHYQRHVLRTVRTKSEKLVSCERPTTRLEMRGRSRDLNASQKMTLDGRTSGQKISVYCFGTFSLPTVMNLDLNLCNIPPTLRSKIRKSSVAEICERAVTQETHTGGPQNKTSKCLSVRSAGRMSAV